MEAQQELVHHVLIITVKNVLIIIKNVQNVHLVIILKLMTVEILLITVLIAHTIVEIALTNLIIVPHVNIITV